MSYYYIAYQFMCNFLLTPLLFNHLVEYFVFLNIYIQFVKCHWGKIKWRGHQLIMYSYIPLSHDSTSRHVDLICHDRNMVLVSKAFQLWRSWNLTGNFCPLSKLNQIAFLKTVWDGYLWQRGWVWWRVEEWIFYNWNMLKNNVTVLL